MKGRIGSMKVKLVCVKAPKLLGGVLRMMMRKKRA